LPPSRGLPEASGSAGGAFTVIWCLGFGILPSGELVFNVKFQKTV